MHLKSPLYAQIELTQTCNLMCNHCYNEYRYSNSIKDELNIDKFKDITKILADNDIFSITLTGGEVLTDKAKLYSLIKAIKENDLELTINSNLTLLTEEDAKKLKDSGIDGIMVSLLSYDEQTHDKITNTKGSFKRTVKGIENLLKENISASANIVVSKHNNKDVYQTGIFTHNLGINSFSAAHAIPSQSEREKHLEHALDEKEIMQYLEDLNKIRETEMFVKLTNPLPYCVVWEEKPYLRNLIQSSTCTAGRTTIQVSPNGDVRPCPMTNKNYGNILEESLKVIWARMDEWNENKFIPSECNPCDLLDSCRSGCRAETERTIGSLNAKHPYAGKPIKIIPEEQEYNIKQNSKIVTQKGIKVREENGSYILFAKDRYMLVPEATTKFIAAINNKKGIIVNKEIMNNSYVLSIISKGVEAGLLKAIGD